MFCIGSASHAQNVINADNGSAQATVRRDDAGFQSCGVRAIVQVLQPKYIETYDFSLNLDGAIIKGLLKVGQYQVPGNARQGWEFGKRKTVMPAPKGFWFAEATSDLPLKPEKSVKAEDAGFALGIADFGQTSDTVMAIVEGKPVQFSLRYPDDKFDRIISFKVEMKDEDKQTFFNCMAGLQRRIERTLGQEK